MEQNVIPGGWSAWSFTPTKEATQIFDETLGKLLGVKYKLVAFATQLVNGTNYAFLCEAEMVTLSGSEYIVLATVHQPIKGKPYIMEINTVGPKPSHVVGGWQNWQFTVTPKAAAILKDATQHLIGATYKGLAFDTQFGLAVTIGTNYCFLCEVTPVVVGATPYPALVFVLQPLQGPAHLEGIQVIRP
jgi:hypothetical protein